ncbi:hypothetical protein JCGZ_22987 [Jatropha curcas]|uniref:Aminotransferase-like plant mobile domain-containing protein n=1 Tax=Jatropha curcas TaxID=180498 RepID=A0A067JPL9_JATCU|nr:hypothetical protein JCGZ_22987 [Jatropha curcas]
MTIMLIDFAAITGLPFGGRSVVFDDRMRIMDRPGLRTSLRAAIGDAPGVGGGDRRDVVARAYLFYLLLTILFMNYGNDANLALLPPLQDLDASRQFNREAATLSYLYYGMDLCVRGGHLKVGCKRAIEIWACEH